MVESVTDRSEGWHESCFADHLGEGPRREGNSVVGVLDAVLAHGVLADRPVERIYHMLGVPDGVDGSPTDSATAGIRHAAAVDPPFSRWMFRDVATPQLIK